MKRLLALLLVLVLAFSTFAGCQKAPAETPAQQDNSGTEQTPPPVEDDGIMKILLIGHSLGNDSSFFFPAIAKNEGETNLVMGVLYHSGCRLVQHVDYLKENAPQYAYYEFDISKDEEWRRAKADGSFETYIPGSANDTYIDDGTIAQTMQFGIQQHDWDMVILQGGLFEMADVKDGYFVAGKELDHVNYIQTIMDYVKENDIEKGSVPTFSWNMIWGVPADDAVLVEDTKTRLYQNFSGYEEMYQAMCKVAKDKIQPAFDWKFFMPTGTAIENLKTTKLTNAEVYRDYAHVTDYGRMVAAYVWYCTIFGKDISECKLSPISWKLQINSFSRQYQKDLELTEDQKNILVEAVGNALKTPYEVTPSQYK